MTSASFLASIALRPGPDDTVMSFPQPVPWAKAYGGETVAAALAAAGRTVDAERSVHSFHGYFLRPVSLDAPVTHVVHTVRDGRGFSTRRVSSTQGGREVYTALVSYATVVEGPDRFSERMPPPWRPPDEIPTARERVRAAGLSGPAAEYWSAGRSFDLRHEPDALYGAPGSDFPNQDVWVRAASTLPDDAATHRLALAYVCDYTILEPSLRTHGLSWSTPGLTTASVDHSMWFHRPVNMNEWLRYVQEPVAVLADRGLNRGRFFTLDGVHVASVVQEGVIRPATAPTEGHA